MNNDNFNDLVLLASMNSYVTSSDDKPIVGTNALATCVGLLMYNPFNKKASVGHFAPSDEYDKVLRMICDMYLSIFDENGFKVEYLVVPGFYIEHYGTREYIEEVLRKEDNIFIKMDVKREECIVTLPEESGIPSSEFAFDTRCKLFVSKDVFKKDLEVNKGKC